MDPELKQNFSIMKDLTSAEYIKKFNKNDYENAFNIIVNEKLNDKPFKNQLRSLMSLEIEKEQRKLILWILELTNEYKIQINTNNLKDQLFQKLNRSDNLSHVWIWNIIFLKGLEIVIIVL